MPIGIGKPEPLKRVRARRRRREAQQVKSVREQCVERDGRCRWALPGSPLGRCDGPSEWAHLGDKKRFKTRGQDPEERHTTGGSAIMCKAHHDAYDGRVKPRLEVEPLTDAGADGPLRGTRDGQSVVSYPAAA